MKRFESIGHRSLSMIFGSLVMPLMLFSALAMAEPGGPTVVVSTTAPDPTNTSPIPVTITFSEAVSGFEITDLVVVNGNAGNFSGADDVYTADITPTVTDDTVTVDVPADVANAVTGAKGNQAADQFSIVYDTVIPTVGISSAPDINSTNASSYGASG